MELLEWQNLFFALPIGVAFLLLILTAIGGFGHGHGGGAHAGGEGHGLHVGEHHIGVHIGEHGHIDHGVVGHGHEGHIHEGHIHDAGHQSAFSRILDLFGIGQIPLTILITIFMIVFGAIGFCSNIIHQGIGIGPNIYFNLSVIYALIGSVLMTRILIPLVARCIPKDESQEITRYEFIGKTGTAILPIGPDSGRFQINDHYGSLHTFYAKTVGEKIESNKEVLVEDYVEDGDYFRVSEFNVSVPQ